MDVALSLSPTPPRREPGKAPVRPVTTRAPEPSPDPSSWSPQHRTDLELWEQGQRRPQQWSEGWNPSAGWLGLLSLERRRL